MSRRPKHDAPEAMNSHDLYSPRKLADEISKILRALGIALGEAYADCATTSTTIAQLEAAKDALMTARKHTHTGVQANEPRI